MKNLADIRRERHELARARARVIINNDGCDMLYFPKGKPVTADAFLEQRTTGLTDKQLTTISYCTISSGFSNFTHNTKVGTILQRDMGNPKAYNATLDFLAAGLDSLQMVLDFAQTNKLEGFWCFRMNDTHDAAHRADKPYGLYPPLKEEHPEWLVGKVGERMVCGTWSSVDYARPEIRQLALQYVEEVCNAYPVDGLELDFCRHLCYFKSTAQGKLATEEEIAAMNELMRDIRQAAELAGARRGRPILIAVRTPDEANYSRGLGLDLEYWMKNDLADLFIGSDYFQLHAWEEWAALGRKHNVPVLAGLSESRVRGEDQRFRRASQWSYRARLARAWQAGVDGIFIFNVFNPKTAFFSECGGPQEVLGKTKHYFATWRDGRPGRYLAGGDSYRSLPILTPLQPWLISGGQTRALPMPISEPDAIRGKGKFTAHVRLASKAEAESGNLALHVNGARLEKMEPNGEWLDLPVPATVLQNGNNEFVFSLAGREELRASAPEDAWSVEYDCRKVLQYPAQLPWRRLFPECQRREEVLADGLCLADLDSSPGSIPHLAYPWEPELGTKSVVEARLKVISSTTPGAVCVRVSNGEYVEMITFEPRAVGLHFAGLSADFPAAATFHTYRIVMQGKDIQVFADGDLLLDGKNKLRVSAVDRNHWLPLAHNSQEWNKCMFYFGSASEEGQGEAVWQGVKLNAVARKIAIKDFVLTVNYDPAKKK